MKREQRGSARRELIAIQKKVWRRLRREIDRTLDKPSANMAIYLEEYERELSSYVAPASRDELLSSVLSADIVYVGDYHTLRPSQKTLIRLLAAATLARPEVTLCMEMVHAKDQAHLDAFMKSEIDAEEFKARINYEETWGFDWRAYEEIFAIARRRHVRVLGINADPRGHSRDHLLERDFRAAEIVVRETLANPRALVLVFDGDLHVARDHLPMLVESQLERLGKKREKTIVQQNSEAIYWALARKRSEHEVSIVRLAKDAYCILNASPIEKLQSYLNWQQHRDELEPADDDEDWAEILAEEGVSFSNHDTMEQVQGLIRTLARFLAIERFSVVPAPAGSQLASLDLDDFQVFTVNDLDFLDYLGERFSEEELEDIKRQIASNESYFIPKGNILYLADLSVATAAEECAHFLHWKCAGLQEARDDAFFDFYLRTVTEALGFLGSKILAPKRDCWREFDCAEYITRRKTKKKRTPKERFQLAACAFVLQHKMNERRWIEKKRWQRLAKVYEQEPTMRQRVTHMLGHMLGDKLYTCLAAGTIDQTFVRSLFFEKHEDRESAWKRYLDLVARTAHVVEEQPLRAIQI